MDLTSTQIRNIEQQLNNHGYDNVEFITIDIHPAGTIDDVVLVWFTEDKPHAKPRYVRAKLDFAATNAPYLDLT